MDKDHIEQNLNIYFQCLTKSYENKDIEPIIGVLYGFVSFYDQGLHNNYEISMSSNININISKSVFIDTLIPFFKKLVSQDDFHLLKKYIYFLDNNDTLWSNLLNELYMMFYPEDFHKMFPEKYYNLMKDLSFRYVINDKETECESNLMDFFDKYKEYWLKIIPRSIKESNKKRLFERTVGLFIAYCYKNNIDSSDFTIKLDYIFNNLDKIYAYVELNDLDRDSSLCYEQISKMILSSFTGYKGIN